jgi:malonate-semialdehyde dehydrogenase (acetylating)/methylmalonate-semialdehyde dehydrogenase
MNSQLDDAVVLDHWINGATSAGTSTRTGNVFDPARGVVAKQVRLASASDVDTAVAAASKAFTEWGQASIAKRQQVMFSFRELLNQRSGELAEILTAEHGKVLSDAAGEIARGLEVVEFACALPHLLKGDMSEQVSSDVDVYTLKQPLGVVGVISPFNFPAMVPMWFFPIAIATGNTVILKPTRQLRTGWPS